MSVNLKQSMLDYYRERAIEYDEVYQGKGPASISEPNVYISEVAILSNIVTRTLSGDIIDIACGTAYWLPSYAHNINNVTLLDQSKEMLIAAQTRAESTGILDRTTLVCSDILNLNGGYSPFDCALIGFFISHLTPDQEIQFFRILRSLLKPHGKMLILDSVWSKDRAKVRKKEGLQERSLNDGRRFQIYKKYFDREDILQIENRNGISFVTEHFGKAFFASQGSFRKISDLHP